MVCTLEVDIGRRAGNAEYPVLVRGPQGGESDGLLDLDVEDLLSRRGSLQNSVIASTAPTFRAGAPSAVERPVRDVGRLLFGRLFQAHVYGQYSAARALAASRGEPLRIVLRLAPPELAGLPWEMLYDEEHDAYLCKQEPLIRHVAVPTPPPPIVHGRLRVLGLVASPGNLGSLDVVGEKRRLDDALSTLTTRVELRWSESGTWRDFLRILTEGPWHIIHFIGHGRFDAVAGRGQLALEDANGRASWVQADRIRDLISVQNPSPRLVVLNSCASAETSVDDLFSSTAATLVRGGACAVVAMQYAITDDGAMAFAESLYRAVASNHTISESVRIGRIGIAGPGQSLEWATPVLYLRGDDSQDMPLFTVEGADGATLATRSAQADTGESKAYAEWAVVPDPVKQPAPGTSPQWLPHAPQPSHSGGSNGDEDVDVRDRRSTRTSGTASVFAAPGMESGTAASPACPSSSAPSDPQSRFALGHGRQVSPDGLAPGGGHRLTIGRGRARHVTLAIVGAITALVVFAILRMAAGSGPAEQALPTTSTSTTESVTAPDVTTSHLGSAPPAEGGLVDAGGGVVSAPSAVVGLRVASVSATEVAVTWSASRHADGYRLAWRDTNVESGWHRVPESAASVTAYTVTGLAPGHEVQVRVIPYNSAGDGPARTLTARTEEAARLDVPDASDLTIGDRTSTAVTVYVWAAARAETYRVSCAVDASGAGLQTRTVNSSGDVTFTGLLPGTTYVVMVTPSNSAGDGPTSTRRAETPS